MSGIGDTVTEFGNMIDIIMIIAFVVIHPLAVSPGNSTKTVFLLMGVFYLLVGLMVMFSPL